MPLKLTAGPTRSRGWTLPARRRGRCRSLR